MFMNFIWLLPELVRRIIMAYGREVSNNHITNLNTIDEINPPMIVISDMSRRFLDGLVLPIQKPVTIWTKNLTADEREVLGMSVLGITKERFRMFDYLEILEWFEEYQAHVDKVIQLMIIKHT